MKHKISILYAWLVKTMLFFFPDYPPVMRLRGMLYSLMMNKCGNNFQISHSATLNSLAGLSFGDNVYLAYNTVVIGKSIFIGNDTIIGPNTLISGSNHVFDGVSYRKERSKQMSVVIKSGSWIGGNCTITAGSILPEKSVLAGGSVLNKKFIEGYTLYGGIPAKKIKNTK